MQEVFADRADAGRRLAERLKSLVGENAVVLALPRGGIPVARPVADALGAPLDVLVARKLGMAGQPELAIGAVTARNHRVLNEEVLRQAFLPPDYLDAETEAQRRRAGELERKLRGARPEIPVAGKIAILVDDGIATGMTMRAAIADVRERGPRSVVVAAPVISARTYHELAERVDLVVAVLIPAEFWAVGQFYLDFRQVTDEEVARQLAEAAAPGARSGNQ